jgi:hypothetical protein
VLAANSLHELGKRLWLALLEYWAVGWGRPEARVQSVDLPGAAQCGPAETLTGGPPTAPGSMLGERAEAIREDEDASSREMRVSRWLKHFVTIRRLSEPAARVPDHLSTAIESVKQSTEQSLA